jgi:hypothetical protein
VGYQVPRKQSGCGTTRRAKQSDLFKFLISLDFSLVRFFSSRKRNEQPETSQIKPTKPQSADIYDRSNKNNRGLRQRPMN